MARLRALWPGTLFQRLVAAWCLVMFVTHLFYALVGYLGLTAYETARTSYYLAKDLGLLVAQLDQAGPAQRQDWLAKMQRSAYRFELGPAAAPAPAHMSPYQSQIAAELGKELGPGRVLTVSAGGPDEVMRAHTPLRDGTVLTAHLLPTQVDLTMWGGAIFAAQILVLLIVTAVAARQATLPLSRLTKAADLLGSSMQAAPISESGPIEVARAAAAFNAMGRRIQEHLAERVRILAAISHDLQTPITRMRLRADLLDDGALKTKFDSDLDSMQVLVEEGIAYARSADQVREAACKVDIDALLEAVAGDYADAGHKLALSGARGLVLATWPHTLRRIVINLVDNAIKFAGAVEIVSASGLGGQLVIQVCDRGPGIATAQLEAVFQPFHRLETSRNRGTGGAGLGLAIARQLSMGLGGSLTLANRVGGGLEATLTLPRAKLL